jgi:large subunit ribosomal protein L19
MTLNRAVRCRRDWYSLIECGKNAGNQEEKTMNALEMISNSSMKTEAPKFEIGDTVRVHVKIKEGDKSRIQVFEGTVIAKKHGGISETFTVRRVAHGCGIERVFPLHSPVVDKVEVVRHGKVRRAKLYYLRDRVGKAAKVKELIK